MIGNCRNYEVVLREVIMIEWLSNLVTISRMCVTNYKKKIGPMQYIKRVMINKCAWFIYSKFYYLFA